MKYTGFPGIRVDALARLARLGCMLKLDSGNAEPKPYVCQRVPGSWWRRMMPAVVR